MCKAEWDHLPVLEEPRVVDIPGYGTLKADPAFVEELEETGGLEVLPLTVPQDLKMKSEAEIRELKEDLGISGQRVDGLIRLLGMS